jgi:hypothetical protein
MPNRRQQILDALKLELQFLEKGGYEPSIRDEPCKDPSIFLDSPLCLNVLLPVRGTNAPECRLLPCLKCWLIDFVPAAQHFEAVPCHHIPLNEHGDTIASMGKQGYDLRVKEAVRDWLWKKSQELEGAPAQSQQPPA